jgi:membrane protein
MFTQASSQWIIDNVPRLSASVAFYTLLSLSPIIIIGVALAALVYGQEAAAGRLASEIGGVAGSDAARAVQEIIKGAYKQRTGVIATLLSLATLALSASSMFVELRDAMNSIWGVPPGLDHPNFGSILRLISDRAYSFAMMLGMGFLLLVSLVLNAWIRAMGIAVPQSARVAILYLVIAVVFAGLYKIVPDITLQWSDVALGALFASLLFLIGKQVMELYFQNAGLGSTYNTAGSPIVVSLWVYYSAQLFFWGVEFSKVYAKSVGSQRDGD